MILSLIVAKIESYIPKNMGLNKRAREKYLSPKFSNEIFDRNCHFFSVWLQRKI